MEGPQGAERARVVKRPLDVTWHEQVEDNGQVYISISSEEEEKDAAQARRQQLRQGCNRKKEVNILIIDSSSDEGEGRSYEIGEEGAEEEDKFVRVKRKLKVLELEEEDEEEEEKHHGEKKLTAVADQEMKKKNWRVTPRQNVGCEQRHVPGVRKQRLGEEDAAFLLFYGNRKTPSATTLRSVIGASCLH